MASYRESIDVRAPISEAYRLFSDFEGFPSFMEGIEEVKRTGSDRLYWRADIAGREEEWEARITERHKDARISWASVSGANNTGTVTFDKLGDDTTRVHMLVEYEPQGFMENVGATLGAVNGRMRGDLQRFKDLAESHHAEAHLHDGETGWREGETRWHDPVEEGRPVDYDPDRQRTEQLDRLSVQAAPGGTVPGGVIPDDRVAGGHTRGDNVPDVSLDDERAHVDRRLRGREETEAGRQGVAPDVEDDVDWEVDESLARSLEDSGGRELRTDTGLMADVDDTPTTSESRRLGEGEDPAVDADDVPLSKEDQRLGGGDLLPPIYDEADFPTGRRISDAAPVQQRPPKEEGEPPAEG